MQLLQLLISGIAQGCIYGLIALGFVLIYKATETVSFAQGELMMLGKRRFISRICQPRRWIKRYRQVANSVQPR